MRVLIWNQGKKYNITNEAMLGAIVIPMGLGNVSKCTTIPSFVPI